MTTFNTGNPLGSTDAYDRHDNSENLDNFSNGPLDAYADRFGVMRQSLQGIRNASQYVILGPYGPGLNFTAKNEAFSYLGEFYAPGPAITLPYTSTGAGASEIANFRSVGDAILRSDLAASGGAELVGSGLGTVADKLGMIPWPSDSGVAGDGATDDTAAFSVFEDTVKQQIVNLGGKAYVVSAVPTKNAYVNGSFIVSTFNRPALPFNTFVSVPAKFHAFGGQLRTLKGLLSDPLNQFVGVVFVGDSITWGSGASGTGTGLPARDGTLSDPRSTFGAPSFVNQFKRYIRENYKSGDGLAEVVSNWAASAVGESTVLYQNTELLYPRYSQFTVAQIGASQPPNDLTTNNSPSGIILSLNNTVGAAQYGHSISFPFTGSKFTLSIRTSAAGVTDAFIDVLVNGTPVITNFDVRPGANGLVDDTANYDQKLDLEIPYVKGGTVLIRSNRNGLTGNRLLSVTALRIPRQVRIVNNGIIGLTSVSYAANNLDGNTSGDGTAITAADDVVFVQLGTNDRAWTTGRPRGSNQFEVNYNALLDNASFTGKHVVLMAANPSGNEDPSVYPFHMQEVRNIIYRTAKARSFDMIDNYSIFQGINNAAYTSDGLHPNDFGHSMICRNIINSLESA